MSVANEVLGKGRHKRLTQCFSTFLKKLSSSCMHKYFSCIYSVYNRICEVQNNFPYGFCLDFFFFFLHYFREGEKCQRVCVLACVWVGDWMHVLFISPFSDWIYGSIRQAWLRWIHATVGVLWCSIPNRLPHMTTLLWSYCVASYLKCLCYLWSFSTPQTPPKK